MTAIILAAGKSTRIKSQTPKVLHTLCGKPLISYIIKMVKDSGAGDIYIVAGHKNELLKDFIKGDAKLLFQERLLGTADAVKTAKDLLKGTDDDILVTCGDAPLLRQETIKNLLDAHRKSKNVCTFLTAILKNPTGYGRVVRNDNGKIISIMEEADASVYEKAIEEINVGTYCFKAKDLFDALDKIRPNIKKKEYYLTDIVSIFSRENKKIEAIGVLDVQEIIGVNSRKDLAVASGILNRRNIDRLMDAGVTVVDPNTTYINGDVEAGQDTIIYPFTIIESGVSIGRGCSIGPFARIRGGSSIKDGALIGNFVEIVRSVVGEGSRVKHHSYLGDTVIGRDVNIGAGTIVANFDGKAKQKTFIDNGAFIGSGTVMVAPVKIGKGAITGAGCVVTKGKDVPDRGVVAGVPARPLKKK